MVEGSEKILDDIKSKLTLDGRKKVLEEKKELSGDNMKEEADPEPLTCKFVIDPILEPLGLGELPERKFDTPTGKRKADYQLRNNNGDSFLVEAKPLNANLFKNGNDGALNQIKGLFTLAEVKENYDFGIATDGIQWIFVDEKRKIVYHLDAREDLQQIKSILTGRKEVSSEKIEEEISEKFYNWYDALLHGGTYKNHDGERKSISKEDCLVENILRTEDEDREEIAQIVMDRLIFIKFLQSKGIISFDILEYLSEMEEEILNDKLQELFLNVLNTEEDNRVDVDSKFEEIPYLNGSLFLRSRVESKNPNYHIRAEILREVIDFLNSFKFIHTEDLTEKRVLDPKILGYIFEKAMTDTERKSTGSYYTPRPVTKYISENTIYPAILERANSILKNNDYKDSELLTEIDELYNLRTTTLSEIFKDIQDNLTICDNACGSGAFLLAAANVLLDVYQQINDELRLGNSEIALRKLILRNNIYGVDINPNAIDIAKLRLWLWLIDSYNSDNIEPLPNLEYNIKEGNSLVGYTDIDQFAENKITLQDFNDSKESLHALLKKREKKIGEYKKESGEESRIIKNEIQELEDKIESELDKTLFRNLREDIDLDNEDFRDLKPFHWGFEFHEVFHPDEKSNEVEGFDVVLGNPPYLNIDDTWGEGNYRLDTIKTLFPEVYNDKTDIYYYFLRHSQNLGQKVGFITSRAYLEAYKADNLRKWLSNNTKIREILDFKNIKVFKGVGITTAITFIDEENGEEAKIKVFDQESSDLTNFEDSINRKNTLEYSQDEFDGNRWIFLGEVEKSIVEKIDSIGKDLSKIADVGKGMETARNTAFTLKKDQIDELDAPSEPYYLRARNSDIERFNINDSGKWLLYLEDFDKFEDLPEDIQDYLNKQEDGLRGRAAFKRGDCKWWKYSFPLHKENLGKDKIISPYYSEKNTFAIDTEDKYLGLTDTTIIYESDHEEDLHYILGLLNSHLLTFRFLRMTKLKGDGVYEYFDNQISEIPIREIDFDDENEKRIHDKICNQVKKLQELKQDNSEDEEKKGKISEIENEINACVFYLYGLNREEITNVLNFRDVEEDRKSSILKQFEGVKQ